MPSCAMCIYNFRCCAQSGSQGDVDRAEFWLKRMRASSTQVVCWQKFKHHRRNKAWCIFLCGKPNSNPEIGNGYRPFLVKLGMVCSSVEFASSIRHLLAAASWKVPKTQADVASYSSVIHASNSGNISQKVAEWAGLWHWVMTKNTLWLFGVL